MFKKITGFLLATILCLGLLAGCASQKMQDGTYTARAKEYDEHGWKDQLVLTISGGKITEVDYDAVNAKGARKSEDAEYKDTMLKYGGSTYPAEFYEKLEKTLLDKQDPKKIDAVAGATIASNTLTNMGNALIRERIFKGDTTLYEYEPAK